MSISIWRDASKTPSLFGIPCTAFLPLFLWGFHWAWWTFWLALGSVVAFGALARLGITFKVLYRKLMGLLRGRTIYARPWWYRNRFQDRV